MVVLNEIETSHQRRRISRQILACQNPKDKNDADGSIKVLAETVEELKDTVEVIRQGFARMEEVNNQSALQVRILLERLEPQGRWNLGRDAHHAVGRGKGFTRGREGECRGAKGTHGAFWR